MNNIVQIIGNITNAENNLYKIRIFSKKSKHKELFINKKKVVSIYTHKLTLEEWKERESESFSGISSFHNQILKELLECKPKIKLENYIEYYRIMLEFDCHELYVNAYSNILMFDDLKDCICNLLESYENAKGF